MRQTLRQIVAVLALVAISMNLVPSALAASYTDVSAANKLAEAGFVNDFSANVAGYRLGDNLLRQEAIGVAGKASGIIPDAPVSDYECEGKFSDISEAWVCRAAELAAKAGITNAANSTFRPKDNLTRYEAMLFAFRGSCTEVESATTSGVAAQAADMGIISSAATFNPNAAATRGEFFRYVAASLDESECSEDDDNILCALDPSFCDDTTDPTDPTAPVTGGDVKVSLDSSSPAGYNVPKGANGIKMASYKLTAGSSDAVVSGIKIKRTGLSVDADTLGFAALVDGIRVTDSKDENSDDEVTLTFKNGGVTIKAGKSVVVDILVDIDVAAASFAEIATTLVDVTSNGTVTGTPVTGSVFRVGTTSAPTVEIQADGSVTNPDLGQTGADLFRFKVKNNNSTNDTVSLHAITFEQTGSIDEVTDLANFKLMKGTEVLATVSSTSSKYLRFNLSTPLNIAQGNNVSLKVVGDVLAGAGEDIAFEIDQKLDVVASSSRYGNAVAVTLTASTFGSVDVEAGVITLTRTNATTSKIREDKDDVVLGSLTITAAQAGLEIKRIGVAIKATDLGVDADPALFIENVQLRDTTTGARYDLTQSTTLATGMRSYYDTSFDLGLSAGPRTFEVIADTLNTIAAFDEIDLVLSMSADTTMGATDTNGGLRVEETSDDELVTDITPSSLSWSKVEGSEAGASVTVLPLADISKVRGATDVAAMQFEIEADESSKVVVDEIKAYVEANAAAATNQMVSQVSLYKGAAVDAAMLLDTVSGSNLATGVATFDGFSVEIPADNKQLFTVTVSFVDGVDASAVGNNPFTVSITNAAAISATDDENDDITVAGTFPIVSARDVTVTDKGTVTLTQDTNNVDNKDPKTILAGTTAKVFSIDVQAQNESVDVDQVVFTLDTNVSGAVKTASLYLNDTLIATNSASDITTTVTFDNLTGLIVPQETKELVLVFNTDTIGFEKVGATKTGVNVTNVALTDLTGASSNADVNDVALAVTTSSKDVAIVPVKVTASLASALSSSSSQAKLKVTVEKGANTVDASNSAPTALLTNLVFSELGNNADGYKIYKEGNAAQFGTISSAGVFAVGTMPSADLTITTDATYIIVPTGTVDKTYSLVLGKSGVVYDVTGVAGATALTSNATTDLELGSRTY